MRPGPVYAMLAGLGLLAAFALTMAVVAIADPQESFSGSVGSGALACSAGLLLVAALIRLVRTSPTATVYELDPGRIRRNSLSIVDPLLFAGICLTSGFGVVLLFRALGDEVSVRDQRLVVVVVVALVVCTIAMLRGAYRAARSGAHLQLGPGGLRWVDSKGRGNHLPLEVLASAQCLAFRNGNLQVTMARSAAQPDPEPVLIRLINYGPNLESVLQALDEYLAPAGGSIQRVNRFR